MKMNNNQADWLDEALLPLKLYASPDNTLKPQDFEKCVAEAKAAIEAKIAAEKATAEYALAVESNVKLIADADLPGTWLNTMTNKKLYNEAEVAERETTARIDENESFKSVFEDAATWVPQCFDHSKPSSYCYACKQRKWFKKLAIKVIPIIDERLSELQATQKAKEV